MKNQVILASLGSDRFIYYVFYGKKHSGSGIINKYSYDEVSKIFKVDALEFKDIDEIKLR